MLCRTYHLTKNEIQIGDVWLTKDLRGKKINNVKISVIFMKKIIAKIWKHYKERNQISLLVHNNNKPAIDLYKIKFCHNTKKY